MKAPSMYGYTCTSVVHSSSFILSTISACNRGSACVQVVPHQLALLPALLLGWASLAACAILPGTNIVLGNHIASS